jgi:hypothetical protein
MRHARLGLKVRCMHSKPEKDSRLGLQIYEMNQITNERIVTLLPYIQTSRSVRLLSVRVSFFPASWFVSRYCNVDAVAPNDQRYS